MKATTKSEKGTMKIAEELAKELRGGEVILLSGNLGAGKTIFAKGLAKALGVKDVVKSPTFNILKCYKIPTTYNLQPTSYFCHIDAYRIDNLNDLQDIGVEDYMGEDTITLIEWADRVKGIEKLSDRIIKIKIDYGKKENERDIFVEEKFKGL